MSGSQLKRYREEFFPNINISQIFDIEFSIQLYIKKDFTELFLTIPTIIYLMFILFIS